MTAFSPFIWSHFSFIQLVHLLFFCTSFFVSKGWFTYYTVDMGPPWRILLWHTSRIPCWELSSQVHMDGPVLDQDHGEQEGASALSIFTSLKCCKEASIFPFEKLCVANSTCKFPEWTNNAPLVCFRLEKRGKLKPFLFVHHYPNLGTKFTSRDPRIYMYKVHNYGCFFLIKSLSGPIAQVSTQQLQQDLASDRQQQHRSKRRPGSLDTSPISLPEVTRAAWKEVVVGLLKDSGAMRKKCPQATRADRLGHRAMGPAHEESSQEAEAQLWGCSGRSRPTARAAQESWQACSHDKSGTQRHIVIFFKMLCRIRFSKLHFV